LSTTVSNDLLPVVFPELRFKSDSRRIAINKVVIVGLAVVSGYFSYRQLMSPNLSVAIFAQNGVYAYFAAAFVPVLFGMFLPKAKLKVVAPASLMALLVHFGVYYAALTPWMQASVKNPAIPAALAISASLVTGLLLYFWSLRTKK
jgi:sodium/pantothenate symporter